MTAMLAKQDAIAKIVRADPAVERVNSFLGGGSFGASNTGRMFAPLKPKGERDSAEDVQARLRKKLASVPGISAFPNIPQNLQLGGRQSSSNYQYTLSSVDKDVLYEFAPQLEAKLRATPGFEDVSSDYQKGAREALIEVDRDAASRLGVPVSAVRADACRGLWQPAGVDALYRCRQLPGHHGSRRGRAADARWHRPADGAQRWHHRYAGRPGAAVGGDQGQHRRRAVGGGAPEPAARGHDLVQPGQGHGAVSRPSR